MINPVTIPPPPRKIHRRPEAGGAWLLWSVVVGGMLLAFAPLALLMARHLVITAGRDVDATVDSLYIARSKTSDTPHVKFHYPLPGRAGQGDQEIDDVERIKLIPGRTVQARVIVFAGWPYCLLMLQSLDAHWVSRWFVAVGTPIGSWMLAWVVWGQDFRDRRLVRTGTAAAGTITGHRVTGDRAMVRYVEFQFTPIDGIERVAEMQTQAWAYAIAKIGDHVTVLYNPNRPAVAAVYELCTYRTV